MTISIIAKKKNKKIYFKYEQLIKDIDSTCAAYTGKDIEIVIIDINKFKILNIGRKFCNFIIKDRYSGELYKNPTNINKPSILSFLFSDSYGEIYCSIENVMFNYNSSYKKIYFELLLCISHSISNLYEIDNNMYNVIISCVQRHNL